MEAVHTSELKQFLKCRLYWFWTAPKPRGLNLEPDEPNKNLFLGRMYHRALQIHYDYGTPTWKAFIKIVSKEGALASLGSDIEDGIEVLRNYDAWAKRADKQMTFISTETEWEQKYSRSLCFAGRFDALVKYKEDLWLLDFKTTSYTEANWTTQDLQATIYTWAARRLIHPDIKGLIFRFIRKKPPLGISGLLLQSGALTQGKARLKNTTREIYEVAIGVAVLAEMRGTSPQGNVDLIQNYCDEILTGQLQGDEKDEFDKRYRMAAGLYYDTLRDLDERNYHYWDQFEPRSEEQIDLTFQHVVVPTAKDIVSRRKGRWIGPTGLGSAWANCTRCAFRVPCEMVMRGDESYKEVLAAGFRKKTPEEYE